jgi:hypothetical protein
MKKLILISLIGLLLIISAEGYAQCAMCKAVTTSNLDSDANDVGLGLNTGILYLMTLPYLMLMGLFYLFFKDKINAKLKSLNLNQYNPFVKFK